MTKGLNIKLEFKNCVSSLNEFAALKCEGVLKSKLVKLQAEKDSLEGQLRFFIYKYYILQTGDMKKRIRRLYRIYLQTWFLEAEFKEFVPRLMFKPRLKYGWFQLKLY